MHEHTYRQKHLPSPVIPLSIANTSSRSLSAAAALLALALTGADLNSQVYVVTDLGTLPGTAASFPVNLNDNGDVVGYCSQNPASMNEVGFVWHNGVMTGTGKLTRGNYSSATAISE